MSHATRPLRARGRVLQVPQPIFALLMVFPVTEASEAHRLEEAAALAAAPSPHAFTGYFMTQTIPNACGTIGLVHAVANTSALLGGRVPLADACWLHTFLSRALALTPDERCAALEADTAAEAEHAAVVSEGQSAVVDDTHQHFAVFVERGGVLWELDGRKGGPVPHGPTAAATLLRDAVAVVKGFMARDPDELRFTLIAMCEAPPQED